MICDLFGQDPCPLAASRSILLQHNTLLAWLARLSPTTVRLSRLRLPPVLEAGMFVFCQLGRVVL